MDWMITHIFQQATPRCPDASWAVRHAESHKDSYALARCRARGIDFIPLAVDTFGGFGGVALKAIHRAVLEGRFGRDHDPFMTEKNYRMRLSIAALRGVALQLARRGPSPDCFRPAPTLYESIQASFPDFPRQEDAMQSQTPD
ncbi:MAG: hypothetical protein GY953_29505, partial [bacterium]|nr:hypothetical protein [bacterium]